MDMLRAPFFQTGVSPRFLWAVATRDDTCWLRKSVPDHKPRYDSPATHLIAPDAFSLTPRLMAGRVEGDDRSDADHRLRPSRRWSVESRLLVVDEPPDTRLGA